MFLTILDGIKVISEISNSFISWSLTVIGASILALIGNSYIKPTNRKVRYIYLIFIPGWILLFSSTYFGNIITRRYAACLFTKNNADLIDFGSKINNDFITQVDLFKGGLLCFAIWLMLYLFWWIRGNWELKN